MINNNELMVAKRDKMIPLSTHLKHNWKRKLEKPPSGVRVSKTVCAAYDLCHEEDNRINYTSWEFQFSEFWIQ